MSVKKCLLSLAIVSVRPVNRVLGFGGRGMTPSDVVPLPWMLTCKNPTPSACLTDTFSKHSTHNLSFNECALASDKAVSAREEARSAHVEISKMEVQDEGGQQRTALKPRSPRNACLCLFLCTCNDVRGLGVGFHTLSRLLQVLVFFQPSSFSVFGGPRLTVFGEWARLSIVGTYKAHGERMESAVSAERAYWTDDRRCFISVLDAGVKSQYLKPENGTKSTRPFFSVLTVFLAPKVSDRIIVEFTLLCRLAAKSVLFKNRDAAWWLSRSCSSANMLRR